MEHKARYLALVDLLLPYQDIWRNEIMLQYPSPLKAYPVEWVERLRGLDALSQWHLLQGRGWEDLGPELAAFHARLTELCSFPTLGPQEKLPVRPQSWIHVIPKKQHELERLAPLAQKLIQTHALTNIVDIGGGQGHFAQTLAHHYGHAVLSLDMDAALQKIGQRWQTFKWPDSTKGVTFKVHTVRRDDQVYQNLLNPHTLASGLHTCGGLAIAHLAAAQDRHAVILNIGCCYHKLMAGEWGLSQVAKSNPLPFNLFALTLAAGAHRKVSPADVVFRAKVKNYRYSLHMILSDEFGIHHNVTLGNCPKPLYDGPFALYAREQLGRLQLELNWSDEDLTTYYSDPQRRRLCEDMMSVANVREIMGRALETAILVDRAIWLEEQGYQVQIAEIFDPHISPRNLAIMGHICTI